MEKETQQRGDLPVNFRVWPWNCSQFPGKTASPGHPSSDFSLTITTALSAKRCIIANGAALRLPILLYVQGLSVASTPVAAPVHFPSELTFQWIPRCSIAHRF